MDLVNQKVTHKAFGEGTIVRQDERHVFVEFGDGSTRQFAYPGAFAQFLTLADDQLQAQVKGEVVPEEPLRLVAQRQVLRKMEESARQPAEQRPSPRPAVREAKAREASAKVSKASTKATPTSVARKASARARSPRPEVRTSYVATDASATTRVAGRPAVFFVFQGPLFAAQSSGSYLWAPLAAVDGTRVRSWDRLEGLRPGDIVLHDVDGMLRAVSRVMALWHKTSDLDGARRYGRPGVMGRSVDCSYTLLENPVWVDGYHDEIVGDEATDLSDGGFAFELDPELARLFLEEAARANPALASQAFVRRYLEG